MSYIHINWARRKDNAWFSQDGLYRIQYNKGAYKDYLYTVDELELGDNAETPAEMYNYIGYENSLKRAKELANKIKYSRYYMAKQEAQRIINDLDWERINK